MTATAIPDQQIFCHFGTQHEAVAQHVAGMLENFDDDSYWASATAFTLASAIVDAVSGTTAESRRALGASGQLHEERASLICPMILTRSHYDDFRNHLHVAKLIVCALIGSGLPVSDHFEPSGD